MLFDLYLATSYGSNSRGARVGRGSEDGFIFSLPQIAFIRLGYHSSAKPAESGPDLIERALDIKLLSGGSSFTLIY